MPISMSPTANYGTQSSIYSCPMLGRLTDKRIRQYEKAGYYGGGIIIRDMKEKARKLKKGPKQVLVSKKQQLKTELEKLLLL